MKEIIGMNIKGELTDAAFWDKQWTTRSLAARNVKWLRGGDFGSHGLFLRIMRRFAPGVFNRKDVIELGGACSRFLVDLAKFENARVCAVDYSPIGVEQTRKMFEEHGVVGEVLEADFFDLPNQNLRYDVVTHWGLLEHFSVPALIISISSSLLKPGGYLVFTMPNLDAAGAYFWKWFSPQNHAAHILHSDKVILEECERAGLQLVRLFHSGPPLLRMGPAEKLRVLATLISVMSAGFLLLGRLFPSIYVSGNSAFSDMRGFVFIKVV